MQTLSHDRPAALPRILVVGAGMAGLSAARILAQHGLHARVLDKGRVPGGRISTRTSFEGWRMDHGAPFLTARDPEFRREVEAWAAAGVVAPWTGRIGYLRQGGEVEPATRATRWVGVPAMRDIPIHLARGLEVRTGAQVPPLVPGGHGWVAMGDAYDLVLVTTPPAQATVLLQAAHPGLAARLEERTMRPCWALMLRLGRHSTKRVRDAGILPWDALFLEHGQVFRWVARDDSRPGRSADVGRSENWVLHAAHGWSERHLEREPGWVEGALVREFAALVRQLGGGAENLVVEMARAHRWRYAAPEEAGAPPEPGLCLWDQEAGIGVAGDALAGGRVEGAFLSGAALPRAVVVSTGAGLRPR